MARSVILGNFSNNLSFKQKLNSGNREKKMKTFDMYSMPAFYFCQAFV